MTMTYSPLFLGQDDVSTHSGKTVHESSSSSSSSDNQVPVINESVETALVGTSSMFASFINVTSTLIGAGIFSLPYAVSRTGYMLGIVLLFLGALFSYMGSVLMSHCVSKTSLPSSYAAVAKVSSLSYLSFIIDGAVLLKCVGVASSYPILIGGLMPAAMRQFHADHGVYDRHLWIFFSLIVCAPLCLLRRVDSLKWTSTLSISFSCFISLLFLSYATRLFNLNPCQISRHSVPCTESVEAFAWSVDALKVFPIFIFCFTCQHCTFGVVNELKSPTQARVNNVFFGAISTAIVLYLIVSISGYTTYGRNVLPNCLKSYPDSFLASVARIGVSCIASFHYPLQCNPGRKCALSIWKKLTGDIEPIEEVYNFRYITITVLFISFTFSMAFSFENLGIAFSLVGATGSTSVTYIIPGICYYQLYRNQPPTWLLYYSKFHLGLGLVIVPIALTFIFLGSGSG